MQDAVEQQAPALNQQSVDLDAIVAKWRWLVPGDVDVYVKWGGMQLDGFAECNTIIKLGQLFIRVAEPGYNSELSSEFNVPRDIEADVVHELLHWRFAAFTPRNRNSAEYLFWEAAVERTAQDLIRLNRRGI